jgi:multidrug efflux pump subunit AcrB
MSHGRTDQDIVAHTHNTARFFTEWRHISWVLLVGTVAWGIFGYRHMPQRKDPDIPIRQALALVPWPGASTEKIEQLVTRRVEEKVAENARVDKIESNTRTGLTAIFITLVDGSFDVPKEFDDIKMKLDSIGNLPDGAGPIQFVKDFGDTAALMLTVASPKTSALEIGLRAQALRAAMTDARAQATPGNTSPRVTIAHGLPTAIEPGAVRPPVDLFVEAATADGVLRDARVIEGSGFVAIDAATDADDAALEAYVQRFLRDRLRASEMHPDAWTAIVVRDPADAEAKLAAVAGDKYTYRELDDYTDLITRTLKTLPVVSKITRSGLLDERVFLEYSMERLASFGVSPGTLRDVLAGRNITATGGILEVGGKNLTIDPSGEFKSEQDIGQVLVPTSNGRAVYLRDLVDVGRGYATPPSYLNFFGARGADGEWRRSRAVTLAIRVRSPRTSRCS